MKLKTQLKKVRSDFESFAELTRLYTSIEDIEFEEIVLDLSTVNWFDANMCAPLGAILYKGRMNSNEISLVNIDNSIEDIFTRNGFLTSYGREKKIDTQKTTIQYLRWEIYEKRYFASYINQSLKGKGIPKMTPALKRKFLEAIIEIFDNSASHSFTPYGVFSCGQLFPKKRCLDFSIVDLGIGIKDNLEMKKGIDLAPDEAIKWALTGSNTTKDGNIPGGLGLKLLREFISLNKGRIIIVSDRGYWEFKKNGEEVYDLLPGRFPGTVVNLEINTADKSSYFLTTEPPPEGIF